MKLAILDLETVITSPAKPQVLNTALQHNLNWSKQTLGAHCPKQRSSQPSADPQGTAHSQPPGNSPYPYTSGGRSAEILLLP